MHRSWRVPDRGESGTYPVRGLFDEHVRFSGRIDQCVPGNVSSNADSRQNRQSPARAHSVRKAPGG